MATGSPTRMEILNDAVEPDDDHLPLSFQRGWNYRMTPNGSIETIMSLGLKEQACETSMVSLVQSELYETKEVRWVWILGVSSPYRHIVGFAHPIVSPDMDSNRHYSWNSIL